MIPLNDRVFVASLCLARAGLAVDPEKTYLIESRLAPIARRESFDSIEDLIHAVRSGGDDRIAWAVVEAMGMPETEFFRDRAGLHRLVDAELPAIARTRPGPIRIWSAACGTGQEIYSLAMLLEDAAAAPPVTLFASDLSERSLEKAQSGLYSQFEVQRGLPARSLVRHFEKVSDMFVLSPRLRQMISWRRANLLDELNDLGQFDVILCRHVLPQLSLEARIRVERGLARRLAPGGRLMLGVGESVGPSFVCLDPAAGLFAPAGGVRSAA